MAEKPASPPTALSARPLDEVRSARGQKLVAVRRSKLASLRAFRRIRADRIAGIIGAVAIVIAAALILVWQNPTERAPSFALEWLQVPHPQLPYEDESLSEPDTGPGAGPQQNVAEYPFDLNQNNATAVIVTFEFQDDIGTADLGQDAFNITVVGPEGSNISVSRTMIHGNVTAPTIVQVLVPLAPVPTITQAPVETEEEARAYVATNVTASTMGIGAWTVVVEMVKAGDYWDPMYTGTPLVGPGDECTTSGPACTADPGNTFTLGFTYTTFELGFPEEEA